MNLYYKKNYFSTLIGFVDAGYRLDPYKEQSQSEYVFTYGDTTILRRTVKQNYVAVSSNHSKIIVIHEVSRECIWLYLVLHHILRTIIMKTTNLKSTTLYEDNAACIA